VAQVAFVHLAVGMLRRSNRSETSRRAAPTYPNAVRNGYYCVQACSYQHEEEHIKNILAENPTICLCVQDGTAIGNDDPNELEISEIRAHRNMSYCSDACHKKFPCKMTEDAQDENRKWLGGRDL